MHSNAGDRRAFIKRDPKTIVVPVQVYDIESMLADVYFRRRTFLQIQINNPLEKRFGINGCFYLLRMCRSAN